MHSTGEPRHVDVVRVGVYGGIGGPHFNSHPHRNQRPTERLVHVVDVAGEVRTEGLTVHDAFDGLEDSDAQRVADDTLIRYSAKLDSSSNC